jgi:hypothetical protein
MSSGLCVSSRVVSANGDNNTESANGYMLQPVQPKQHKSPLRCFRWTLSRISHAR